MNRAIVIPFVVLLAWPASADQVPLIDDHSDLIEEMSMRNALIERMVVWRRRDGSHVYVGHCRAADGGCELRIERFTRWFFQAAERYRFDPWILAAMAVRESSLNPDARGARGELGLLQLHPYSAPGIRARQACRRAPTDCPIIVVNEASAHLAQKIRQCSSLEHALTAYNSGTCGTGTYATKVLRERAYLSRFVGGLQ